MDNHSRRCHRLHLWLSWIEWWKRNRLAGNEEIWRQVGRRGRTWWGNWNRARWQGKLMWWNYICCDSRRNSYRERLYLGGRLWLWLWLWHHGNRLRGLQLSEGRQRPHNVLHDRRAIQWKRHDSSLRREWCRWQRPRRSYCRCRDIKWGPKWKGPRWNGPRILIWRRWSWRWWRRWRCSEWHSCCLGCGREVRWTSPWKRRDKLCLMHEGWRRKRGMLHDWVMSVRMKHYSMGIRSLETFFHLIRKCFP